MEITVVTLAGIGAMGLVGSRLVRSSEGLKVLVDPENSNVDIVFVHGLGGERLETWTAAISLKTKTNWMTDVLPSRLSHRVRILSYGYSLKLFSRSPRTLWGTETRPSRLDEKALRYLPQAVRIHSNRLLEQLTALRSDVARDRPIIWIGHTLGGLIVKHALVQASAAVGENSEQKATHLATCGALYFETPMQDTLRRPWAKILASMMSVSLRVALPTNVEKPNLTFDEFDLQSQRYKSIERHFRNFSFSKQTRARKGGGHKISGGVPDKTLVLDNASQHWMTPRLRANDLEMIQLPPEDYQIVIKSIQECLNNIQEVQLRSSAYYAKLGIDRLPVVDVKSNTNAPLPEASKLLDDTTNEIEILETELSRTTTTKSTASSIEEAKTKLRDNERKHGYVHGQTLSSLITLAQTYESQSSFLSAELLYKRAFVAILDLETYGPWHTYIAKLLRFLSEVEIEQGKFLEAAENLLYLLKFQEKRYGATDLYTTRTMARIAVLYDKLQRWEDAEELYLSVIKAREQKGEGETMETLTVMENLALSYRLRGGKTLARSASVYKTVHGIRKGQFDRFKGELDPQTKKLRTKRTLSESSEYVSLGDIVSKLMEVYESLGDLTSWRELFDEWSSCLEQTKANNKGQST